MNVKYFHLQIQKNDCKWLELALTCKIISMGLSNTFGAFFVCLFNLFNAGVISYKVYNI